MGDENITDILEEYPQNRLNLSFTSNTKTSTVFDINLVFWLWNVAVYDFFLKLLSSYWKNMEYSNYFLSYPM